MAGSDLLTNTVKGESYLKHIFGNSMIIIPYIIPGFDLASFISLVLQKLSLDNVKGIILMNHGMYVQAIPSC